MIKDMLKVPNLIY